MPSRSFSIHGHFYQPPREDPLTGVIPVEASAAPYPNWNERIHAECYRPNAEMGNFERISFNIGPTLFSWMHSFDPEACRQIVEQDRKNLQRHGVGNAMAQAYNHTILPLACLADKELQVYWGVADFRHRFGRLPQGMWLPETAVDHETLEILARQGLQFTILAPWQAEMEDIDTTEPYTVALPGDARLTVFFYQREVSTRISFDPAATVNADEFARQVLQASFGSQKTRRSHDQLLLVASDGELYGHHQPHRERFLAHLLDGAGQTVGIQPTYPALWLQSNPPRRSVAILPRTSWSCHHGVGRWTGECSCTPGDGAWKKHLRQAFYTLADQLDRLYLEVAHPLVRDPWLLRQRYIHVLLGEMSIDHLAAEMGGEALAKEPLRRLHLALEMQRERQRMFTSCGWFFDDFDRIEPRNNVAYAAQAVRLARLASGDNLEAGVIEDLKQVVSPRTGLRASDLFQRHLRHAQWVHSVKVGFAD